MTELIIGDSPPIQRIRELISQVVDTDLSVLICGESGVGKELVALTLHARSSRNRKALVKVNCAALPGELLESELFGYEKGAFTGAVQPKAGKFELADHGTIFLDEIGDMPLRLQAKLLQVLQDGEFARVGGLVDKRVDTWVISATNHNLDQDVQKGLFREDLFYRLNIIKIVVPPLRERKDDLPLLVKHFVRKHDAHLKGKPLILPERLERLFEEYHWPGNVRELENYLRRLMVLRDPTAIGQEILYKMQISGEERLATDPWAPDEALLHSVLENCRLEAQAPLPSLKEIRRRALAHIERAVIEEALKRTRWNRKQAARMLQISYKALLYKMKDFDIQVPESAQRTNRDTIEVTLPEGMGSSV